MISFKIFLKFHAVIVLIISLTTISANAQTDTTNPSTDDAIAFINKVYNACPINVINQGDIYFTQIKFVNIELKNCKLYFYYYTYKYDYNFTTDYICNIFDLSNCNITGIDNNKVTLYTNKPGSVTSYVIHAVVDPVSKDYSTDLGNYVKNDFYNGDINNYGFVNAKGFKSNEYNSLDVLSVCNHNDLFNDNNYGLRLKKAYELIIKNCGGGRSINDKNDKF